MGCVVSLQCGVWDSRGGVNEVVMLFNLANVY
jgi:hypothetical protein